MMTVRTLTRFVIGASLLLLAFNAARAQDLAPAAFYGTFQGSGFAENKDSIYFGTTVRNLDVIIASSGSGFSVT